ncbi:MAG: hypothetical protein AMS18_09475 [Gemmatimonas sp. SG8_17]|nr:MAG: hypothetical protein AMS18_09475 [Gemmatimonas sp. SG8_17]
MAYPLRALPLSVLAVFSALLSGCQDGTTADGASGRWRIEVLEEEIDSVSIPDRFPFDFDGDGVVDRLEVTESSVHVSYADGTEFTYAVREPGEESPRIWDAEVLSLSGDGSFPSIILATCPEPSHSGEPANQELIYNDEGRLIPKRQGVYPATNRVGSPYAYPMRALGLDCAWIRIS